MNKIEYYCTIFNSNLTEVLYGKDNYPESGG